MHSQDVAEIVGALEYAERITLVCHRKPDGDALGSTLGLGLLLEQQGKSVRYVCVDPIPEHYRFLPGSQFFTTDLEVGDVTVQLDCGSDHMAGLPVAESAAGRLIDLDHHPKPASVPSPRLTLYDDTASSTAELVYRLALRAGWPINRAAATCLLTGIITDTAAFQNANTKSTTMEVAADLLRHGAKLKDIITNCFYSSSVPKLKLWGTAMSRINRNPAAGIVSTVLTYDDVIDCGAHPDDVEGLVGFLNAIPGVPALLLLTDLQQGEIKGSLRTRDTQIDVARLAQSMGGGGHRAAAGFTVPGRLKRNPDDTWRVLPTAN